MEKEKSTLQKAYDEREKQMLRFKQQYEEMCTTAQGYKSDLKKMNANYLGLESRMSTQNKVNQQQIDRLKDNLNTCKDKQTDAQNRLEHEKKTHLNLHSQNLELKTQKDMIQNQYDTMQDQIQILEQEKTTLKQHLQELQKAYNEIMVVNAKSGRELQAKDELIQHITSSHTQQIKALRNDFVEYEHQSQQKLECELMS